MNVLEAFVHLRVFQERSGCRLILNRLKVLP